MWTKWPQKGVMGAYVRVAAKTLKGSFMYHALVANRDEYKSKKNIENTAPTGIKHLYLSFLILAVAPGTSWRC